MGRCLSAFKFFLKVFSHPDLPCGELPFNWVSQVCFRAFLRYLNTKFRFSDYLGVRYRNLGRRLSSEHAGWAEGRASHLGGFTRPFTG